MKVLLSAYSCEPNRGSEPGVGWNRALEVARMGYDVWVLTRAGKRAAIERELAKSPPITNLRFLYYDLPLWPRWLVKDDRGIYLHYFLWQWGAYLFVKKFHQAQRFDRVHHITMCSIRQPSFMGNLGIPFIFGPVAGGERAPWNLRQGYGWRGWIMDGIRDLSNFMIRMDPLVRRTFKQAERIYVTSEQTLSLLPLKYRKKATVLLAIGLNSGELACLPEQGPSGPVSNNHFRLLYVGQIRFLKGMHLGFPAFADLLKKFPDSRITIVGEGPDEKQWRTLTENLGIGERIEWINWLDRKELPALYAAHDVFLFPSLRDSGGMVVLEAMSFGLPIVCLDLGGPGQMVDDTCGFKVETNGLSKKATIQALADCLIRLAGDSTLHRRLSNGAIQRVKKFSWSSVTSPIYRNGNYQD